MLAEAKDTSELMVDLAYAAVYFNDPGMCEEVADLEERLNDLVQDMRAVCILAVRRPAEAESMASVLQVIGAIVTCFTNAMAAHHEMAKYPPVRGMPEVRDPLTDFSDLEDKAFWEKSP